MRKKITLLVAVLVGLLAFGVACSPALSDQPVVTPQAVEPEPDTVEIPEVPPIPSKDTPKVIAQHGVKARVVTIPGGKSVKELADVFGGYVHKPRRFRDSKGRRVAYSEKFGRTVCLVPSGHCKQ